MKERWIYAGVLGVVLLLAAIFFVLAPEDAGRSQRAGRSVFDSEFWRGPSGSTTLTESDPYLALQEKLNPSTGSNYTIEEIKRIKYLSTKFPDNRLIPRVESAEEEQKRLALEKELEDISLSMTAGTAAEEDIHRYYEDRKRLMLDRLQLVRFVLEEESGRWGPDVRKQYSAMIDHGQKVLDELEDRRKRSIEALRVRRSAQR